MIIGGTEVEVRVRESPRARTARIVVGHDRRVEIVVPRRVTYAEIDRMLEDARAWIERKTQANEVTGRRPQLGLALPGVVWLELEPIPIEVVRTMALDSGPVRARLRNGRLVVAEVPVSAPDDELAGAIERWYRHEARRLITESVERNAARLNVAYGAIAIRDQRTRWGSCSRRGTLSFNWRLAIAPRDVREYVVIHELCHLRELNHSKAFWRLLDEAMPGWQEHKRWLGEHGYELQAYEIGI
jgi:predicted metal-dependent hydrolase